MALLTPATAQQLAGLKATLAFGDAYRLYRSGGETLDDVGNAVVVWVEIEAGMCRLLSRQLQPQEMVIADKMGWTSAYAIQMPYDSLAAPEHVIRIGQREFVIGGVSRAGLFGLDATVVAEERSH